MKDSLHLPLRARERRKRVGQNWPSRSARGRLAHGLPSRENDPYGSRAEKQTPHKNGPPEAFLHLGLTRCRSTDNFVSPSSFPTVLCPGGAWNSRRSAPAP